MAVPVSCLCRFLKEFLVRHLPKLSAPFHYLFVRASDTRNPLMGLALLDVADVIPPYPDCLREDHRRRVYRYSNARNSLPGNPETGVRYSWTS